MASVLLVNAPVADTSTDSHAGMHPPLGLGYIATVLRERDHRVSARDLNVTGMNPAVIERAVETDEPDVVGISAHTETYPNALTIAETATKISPGLTVVMGGPHVTVRDEAAAEHPAVDYVIRGEGEETMAALVESLETGEPVEDIRGLTYAVDGTVVRAPDRPLGEDPGEVPRPARDLFPMDLYQHPGNVLFSRGGCPFQCHFCAVNSIWGEGWRAYRPVEDVIEEVRHLLEDYGLRQINFADDTFTLRRDRVHELLDALETIEVPQQWSFTCATRVDLVDKGLLERLGEAGCSGIQFGVEAGSQRILDAIGKNISLEGAREAVETAVDLDMDVLASFMFPHPEDTAETIMEQARFMRDLKDLGAGVSLAFTTPYPGTRYDEYVADGDIEVRADGWDEYDAKHLLISTRHLSFEELEELRDDLLRETGLEKRTPWPDVA